MRKQTAFKFFIFFALIITLTACTNTRTAQFAPILEEPRNAKPAPIKFTKLKSHLPLGKNIGTMYLNCIWDHFNVNSKALNAASQRTIENSFSAALEPLGYDVINTLNADFEEEIDDELMRTEYKISAKIIDADLNACANTKRLFKAITTPEYKGEIYLNIEWAVYDNLRKKTVYKTTTQGYSHQKQSNSDGLELMISNAFAMAAHNLATEKNFHDLIFFGKKPPEDWRPNYKNQESRNRAFDPMESITITNSALSAANLTNHIEETRKIAVLIQSGTGHGSGFFITDQGHILTNHHVVGNALRVRVLTAQKEHTLIAEVLRSDKVRDVAVLKLENKPENLHIVTAPIQTTWPPISAEIFALGSPNKTSLQDTITKGIVSAHRKNFKIWGTKLDLIQGDVSIHGGNSGGPILDEFGNITAIAVAGFGETQTLNFFIPIEEALNALNIGIKR